MLVVRWRGWWQTQLGFGCDSSTEIVCCLATCVTIATGAITRKVFVTNGFVFGWAHTEQDAFWLRTWNVVAFLMHLSVDLTVVTRPMVTTSGHSSLTELSLSHSYNCYRDDDDDDDAGEDDEPWLQRFILVEINSYINKPMSHRAPVDIVHLLLLLYDVTVCFHVQCPAALWHVWIFITQAGSCSGSRPE